MTSRYEEPIAGSQSIDEVNLCCRGSVDGFSRLRLAIANVIHPDTNYAQRKGQQHAIADWRCPMVTHPDTATTRCWTSVIHWDPGAFNVLSPQATLSIERVHGKAASLMRNHNVQLIEFD
ncbi:hypothetical protein M8J77_017749 [Diaphorina citri]|nr:hypothetical protein M8J77_017749 [Diaphorina citri]